MGSRSLATRALLRSIVIGLTMLAGPSGCGRKVFVYVDAGIPAEGEGEPRPQDEGEGEADPPPPAEGEGEGPPGEGEGEGAPPYVCDDANPHPDPPLRFSNVTAIFDSRGNCVPCHPTSPPNVYSLASLRDRGAVVPCDGAGSKLLRELTEGLAGRAEHGTGFFPPGSSEVATVTRWIVEFGAPE
jgi:hypothetical protein